MHFFLLIKRKIIAGLRNEKSGYDGFVAVSSAVFREFDPTQQRQIVDKTLEKAIPGFMLIMAS